MVFQFLIRKEEEIRTRIHSFKMPIRDWRARWAVTALYFCAPILGGWLAMPYIVPDPEKMRDKLTANLTPEDLARIQQERDRLQAQYEEARRQREMQRAKAS